MPRAITALSILAIAASLISCGSYGTRRAEKRAEEHSARAAAARWLEMLDDGDYEEAFEFEAQDFRMYRTQSQFVRFMQARRAPFGKMLSREFIGAARHDRFVGAPEGKYETVLFKTAFEHKWPTAERVILLKQSIGWRVIDYRIY